MTLQAHFPIWEQLNHVQKQKLLDSVTVREVQKGEVIHRSVQDCLGLVLVRSGQLRAHVLSKEGREITLYRLFERDFCLLTASCLIHSLQFHVTIAAEKNSLLWIIPASVYQNLMNESTVVSHFTNELMATRFSEVMWLIEQVLWKSMDKRLALFLLEEKNVEKTSSLKITHEQIANHLGTHREVITRLLRYFQNEGVVQLSRGTINIQNEAQLKRLQSI